MRIMWKKILSALCLLAILVAAGAVNTQWINQHTLIDGISEGDLVEKMITFAHTVENNNYDDFFKYLICLEHPSDTPNILFALGYVGWQVFGRDYRSLLHVMTVIYIFLIAGTYLVTRKFSDSYIAALIAACFVAVYPMIYELSRSFTTYPLSTAIFCFSILLLINTKDFTKFWWSLAFGLAFGINLISERGTPPLFMIGPLAYTLYRVYIHWKNEPQIRSLIILNIATAGVLASVIALPYLVQYAMNNFIHNVELINQDIFAPESPWYGRRFALPYYPVELDRTQAGPGAGVLFFLMLIVVIRNKPKYAGYLYTWLGVPFIIFTAIAQKAETYTIAWLPAVAAVTGIGLVKLRPKGIGALLFIPVFGLTLFHFVDNSYMQSWASSRIAPKMGSIKAWALNKDNYVRPRPLRKGYHHFEVAKEIADKYSEKEFVFMVNSNPDPIRDDRMDMAFLVAIHNPSICQYYPTSELFDHEDDRYVDTVVIRPDTLKKLGCPLNESFENEIRLSCIYQFLVHYPDKQEELADVIKSLPKEKIKAYDLGHDMPLNLYEITCP